MTGTLPPWSPLNDPRLSAQVDKDLHNKRSAIRNRAELYAYLLQRYAWQEYPVKCGRWRITDDPMALTGGAIYSGPWTKKAWTPDVTRMLLLDPATRQPIAAHVVPWNFALDVRKGWPVDTKTTSIWFAGDPRVCGMFTPVGDGHRVALGCRSGREGIEVWEGPEHFERLAARIAAEPYVDATPPGYGPWIADTPKPPPRPKRFAKYT
ncbi:hypothetical protein KGA66_07670 [Actinocrinis puniceicyclus]|uniref:Uncharacterized protein n=1 Tax=Actinocrinis puniceicyclus TaxID=977794 RepID=A0A8J8BCA6_9ACTN|nr:hypothetical protein [Actinocrinis puniceicyclus]MBS2962916.1 hypothetical protein [Actinocrinis puniceicyclus]